MNDATVADQGDVLVEDTGGRAAIKNKRGLINSLSIRNKLIGLLVVFGLVPALVLFAILEFQGGAFHVGLSQGLAINAKRMIDVIERNLYERYGDVQAFGLNTAALNPANWRNPTNDNPLVNAMNGYMTGYGIYQLMVMVSPKGELLAVNTVGPKGDPLDTGSLYNRSFADKPWLKDVLAGKFLEGDGLSGTNVTDVHFNSLIDGVYGGSNSYSLIYAAPVKDAAGNVVAVWANYTEFGLVEDIVAEFYKDYAANGQPSTELTLIDQNGAIIVDYDPADQGWQEYPRNRDVIGKVNLAKLGVEAAVAAVKGAAGTLEKSFHARKKVYQAAGFAHTAGGYNYPGVGWSALIRSHVDEAYALWNSTILEMIIALAVSAAVVLVLGFFVGKGFSRPITAMTGAMAALANGNLDIHVPAKERGDEIGEMAATVQVFKDNALEMKRLEAKQKEAAKRAEQEKRQAMLKLADDFESSLSGVVEGVSSASTELLSSSETMAKAAEVSHQQAESVAATSEQASGNVQTMSSAAEELASSISKISRQVAESSNISSSAVEEAKKANEMIRGLAEASDRVGEVVTLINEIAEQTNLLALNATIEAARAGDAGKGFAVVASEVKTLANQTGKATEEISAQIGGMRDATQNSVKAIEGIAEIIGRIDEIASSIASAIEEQGAATQEIARNAEQAATGTNEVSKSVTRVTEAASETGTAAQQIQSAAADLSKQSELLRSEVGKFLSQVRSG